jgi:putative Mn2+ efflux pump MntP
LDISLFEWGQFITLLMVAFALGMDAFSLSVGVGMVGIRLRDVLKVSVTIGLFHIGMPLVGIVVGMYLSELIGNAAIFISGVIMMAIGMHMLWNGFRTEARSILYTHSLGLFLFAFSVSVDSLTVGFSLGLIAVNKFLAVCLFGMMGCLLTGFGLLLGRSMAGWLGEYSEILGGLILFAFGLKFMF